LAILREEPQRRARLAQLVDYAQGLIKRQIGLPSARSQILPIIVGESGPTLRMAEKIQSQGFDVRAIRPPTVPEGSARLRISITLNVDESAIDGLADALEGALAMERALKSRHSMLENARPFPEL
jgi:8-amino-7-oxononanoate synthase